MDATTMSGTVRGGVIVPDSTEGLSEGARVSIILEPAFTPEEQAEFEAWDRLSDEAWAMIDQWEREDRK